MESLDINALFNITKGMDIVDILSMCETSSQMKKICDSNLLWIYLLRRDYNIPPFKYVLDPTYGFTKPFKTLYTTLRNDTSVLVLTKNPEESYKTSEEIIEIGYGRIIYMINTNTGNIINHIKLTDTYKLLSSILLPTEMELMTYEEAFSSDEYGFEQLVYFHYITLDDKINSIQELLNFGYVVTDADPSF